MRTTSALLLVTVSSVTAWAQPGLASRWSAEGSTADSAGPNPGVAVGPLMYGPAVQGQGFELESAYINVPNPVAGGLQASGAFTVTAWIRQGSFVSTSSIVNLRTSANASGFTLENQFSTPGTMLWAVNNTGVAEGFATLLSAGWQLDRTYHIAASFDPGAGSMRIYRDGDLVASRSDLPAAGMAANAASLFQIGRNIVAGPTVRGLIDEASVYSRALTPAEIECLVQPGRIRQQPVGGAVCPGGAIELRIITRGSLSTSYQWRHDAQTVGGATADTLLITDMSPEKAGQYDCIVTTGCGVVTSAAAAVVYCTVDLNCDALVDFGDYLEFLNRYDAQDPSVDFNQDGLVDFGDYLEFLNLYDAGC